jgi:hypothetical protein
MRDGNYILTGGDIPQEDPIQKGKRTISPYILEQLKSRNEGVVLLGIRNMVDDRRYSREEVCELLVGVIRRGVDGMVALKAGDGLISALGEANPSISARTIKSGLFAVSDANGWVLSRIIAEPILSGEIRKAAIDLLSRYRAGEIGKETMQEIERILTLAVSNEKDDPRMRKTIEMAFSRNPSGPRISSVPARAPWDARRTLTQPPAQNVVAQTGKPVKA